MNASKLSPDDPRLTAYALGELPGDERAAIEAALTEDPIARAYVEETRRFAAHLQSALVDEPLPNPNQAEHSPASQLHLLPPYEPKGSKLLQFPYLYFVLGGVAAACFAVMVALQPKRVAPTYAKQYVEVDLNKVRGEAAESATAEASLASNDQDTATTAAPSGAANAGVDSTPQVLTAPPITASPYVGLAANDQPSRQMEVPGTTRVPASDVARADTPAGSPDSLSAPPATSGVATNGDASAPKRVVAIVSKRNRKTAPTPAGPRVTTEVGESALKPLEPSRPDFADLVPLPPPAATTAEERGGGEFVAAKSAPVVHFSAPNDTGSYATITKALKEDKLPDPKSVAIEELLNRGIGAPSGPQTKIADGTLAAFGEVGPAPWAPTHRLVRLLVYAGAAPAGGGALAARDVAMEVEFNPRRVIAYRLIGYERDENAARRPVTTKILASDFRPNRGVVALFEVIPAAILSAPDPDDPTYSVRHLVTEEQARPRPEMLTLRVQYRHAVTGLRQKVATPVEDIGATFIATTTDFKYSAGVAAYGMILRHSSHRGRVTLGDAITWAEAGVGSGPAAREREEMLDLMRRTRAVMQARHG